MKLEAATASNRLASPLLALPAELRIVIYELVIDSAIPEYFSLTETELPAITGTCKQTREESLPVVHARLFSKPWLCVMGSCLGRPVTDRYRSSRLERYQGWGMMPWLRDVDITLEMTKDIVFAVYWRISGDEDRRVLVAREQDMTAYTTLSAVDKGQNYLWYSGSPAAKLQMFQDTLKNRTQRFDEFVTIRTIERFVYDFQDSQRVAEQDYWSGMKMVRGKRSRCYVGLGLHPEEEARAQRLRGRRRGGACPSSARRKNEVRPKERLEVGVCEIGNGV